MVKTFGLTHIALAVHDVERAVRFYHEVFGMVAVYRENGFIQAQTPGSQDVLVLEEKSARGAGSGRIAHFGFRLVDPHDIDEAVRAVEAAGGEILTRGEFCPGEPYLFCRDLDGYEIEIWHELPTPVDPVQPAGDGKRCRPPGALSRDRGPRVKDLSRSLRYCIGICSIQRQRIARTAVRAVRTIARQGA